MAKYVALLAVSAFLCFAYVTSADVVDDYGLPGYGECKSKLDKGSPRCFEDVYFNLTAPTSGECCRNYVKMEHEDGGCFDLLFDDPTTWLDGLMMALRRCREMLMSPAYAPAPYR